MASPTESTQRFLDLLCVDMGTVQGIAAAMASDTMPSSGAGGSALDDLERQWDEARIPLDTAAERLALCHELDTASLYVLE